MGLSVAIFAPGWTYEIAHRDRDKLGPAGVHTMFHTREHTFWGLLEPFLNFHAPNLQSSCDQNSVVGAKDSLRFKTCFSLGRGLCSTGSDSDWYNLRKMEFQPSIVVVNEGENNDPSVLDRELRPPDDQSHDITGNPGYHSHVSDECPYKLSQSLKIVSREKTTIPIFLMNLPLKPNESILFIFTFKVSKINVFVYLMYQQNTFKFL